MLRRSSATIARVWHSSGFAHYVKGRPFRVTYCGSMSATWFTSSAARLVRETYEYDRGLTQLLHTDLHWLDVADRVRYKLGVTVQRCLHNKAPQYIADCYITVSDIADRRRLRSVHRHQLDVPVTNVARSAVGHSLSPDPSSGTCFQISSEIQAVGLLTKLSDSR